MSERSDRSDKATAALRKAAAVVFWLVIWQLASVLVGSHLLLAGPCDTAVALFGLVSDASFWSTIWFSFSRIVLGFAVAFIISVALGIVSSRHEIVADLLRPPMTMFKSTPVVCIVVLLLIWFGSKNVSTIAVFLVVCPALWFTTTEACARESSSMGELFDAYHVRGSRRLLAYTWQQILPFLVSTCETVVGMSWKAGVAAELIGVPLGSMGERIYQSKLLLETADLFAWTAVVILLAWLCERAFLAFLRSTGPFALHLAVPRRTREADVTSSSEGICLEDVRLAYGDQVVFGGLSIDLPTGSRTCLVDASGVGKTSVLRLIAGETEPSAGSVSVPAVVSMMFQDSRLLDDLSAVDNVLLLCGSVSRERANSLLGEVLPVGVLDRPVRELSGGQRRRVELVRSLAFPGEAVLLDEPFGGLDETSHARSGSFICDHLGGRTLVVATHDVADAALLGGDAVRLLELDASRRPPTASDALPRE